ncbi:MAG: VPLPA-CTERM sorting domain-containing protein [Gammaproteobacteria bacterium]
MKWKQSILVTIAAIGIGGAAGATTVSPPSMNIDSTVGPTSIVGANGDVTTTLSMPGFSLNMVGYSGTNSVPPAPTLPAAASDTGNGFGPIAMSYYYPLTSSSGVGSGTTTSPVSIQIGHDGSGMLSIDASHNGQSLLSLILPSGGAVNTGSGSSTSTDPGVGVSAVPLPAAVWLFGSGLVGLVAVSRRSTSRRRFASI